MPCLSLRAVVAGAASAFAVAAHGLLGFANTSHLPAYFQVNVGVAHTFDLPTIGKLKTRFTVINLFDRSYESRDGTGIGVGAPQYVPRRSSCLAVSKSFFFEWPPKVATLSSLAVPWASRSGDPVGSTHSRVGATQIPAPLAWHASHV